jgi:hypothetical protein
MISDKPLLLPDKYADLQDFVNALQREILKQIEVFSLDSDGYAVVRLTLGDYANDAAAAAGSVPVGGIYRNGSVLQVRVS